MALGLVLLVVLTALVVDHHAVALAAEWMTPILDTIVGLLNPIGSGVVPLIACATIGGLSYALRRSRLRDAANLGALAFAAAGLVEFSIKHLVGRPRPDAALPALTVLGPSFAPDVDSFPSGHATSMFAVATVFTAFYPRGSWLFYPLATAVAVGRVYLGRHYVSDILAGAVVGSVIALYLVRSRARLGWGD